MNLIKTTLVIITSSIYLNAQISMLNPAGSTIQMTGKMNLTISGNWINYGEFTADSNTIEFNGSTDQFIYEFDKLELPSLEINKAAGLLYFSDSVIVRNNIILRKGIISSTENAIVILDSSCQVLMGNDSSFVVGPIDRIFNTDKEERIFPFGFGTSYRPLKLKLYNTTIAIVNGSIFDVNSAGFPIHPLVELSHSHYYKTIFSHGYADSAKISLAFTSDDEFYNLHEIAIGHSDNSNGSYLFLGTDFFEGTTLDGNIQSSFFNPIESAEYFSLGTVPTRTIEIPEQTVRQISLPLVPFDNDYNIPKILKGKTPFYMEGNDQLFIPTWNLDSLEMDILHGYKIYNDFAMEITTAGSLLTGGQSIMIDSNSINLIGYPYSVPHTAEEIFGNYTQIKYADDGEGNVYIPEWGLTDFTLRPGIGYKIYADDEIYPFTFPILSNEKVYKQSDEFIVKEQNIKQKEKYFRTGNMYAIILNNEEGINEGDEISIFDSENCVGASLAGNMRPIVVAAWLEDTRLDLQGARLGSDITIKINNNPVENIFTRGGKFGENLFSVASIQNPSSLPTEYQLFQNYPNPFNPSTIIKFSLPEEGHVTLGVYNILGEVVEILINEEMQPGYHQQEFNSNGIASGIYIYRLQVNDYHEVSKMVLLK